MLDDFLGGVGEEKESVLCPPTWRDFWIRSRQWCVCVCVFVCALCIQ